MYLDVFHQARRLAFTEEEAASPLAEIPYQLRHACVSTWLNAGVPATQIAEWAGHSVAVLLRVYAKCIAGQQAEAKRRILDVQPEDTRYGPPDHRLENATPEIPGTPDDDGEDSQTRTSAAPDAHGRVSIMIRSDNVRDGLFGIIHLSARSGAIVSAYLTYGMHGDETLLRRRP